MWWGSRVPCSFVLHDKSRSPQCKDTQFFENKKRESMTPLSWVPWLLLWDQLTRFALPCSFCPNLPYKKNQRLDRQGLLWCMHHLGSTGCCFSLALLQCLRTRVMVFCLSIRWVGGCGIVAPGERMIIASAWMMHELYWHQVTQIIFDWWRSLKGFILIQNLTLNLQSTCILDP